MSGISDIERSILNKNENFDKSKKNKYAEEEYGWWTYDNKETFFCVTSKRKNTYKKGE